MEGNFNNLFNYKITYSNKRKRTIAFKIENDFLYVISPKNVSKNFLMDLVKKRSLWALEKINKKKEKRKFVENNKIVFLGKEIDIKIKENPLLKYGGYCELINNILNINICNNYDKILLMDILKKWYKDECLKIINKKVIYYAEKHNFQYGTIKIKEQKTVWGSCNFKNNLTFNWKIMLFEPDVIDYLIIHELSHTIHKNHSDQYWGLVKSILPNYKKLNDQLRNLKISI